MEQQKDTGTISYPNQMGEGKALASIASLLKESENQLPILRAEFRGEATIQYSDGTVERVQVSKPLFVRVSHENGDQPIKEVVKYKTGTKEIYIPNDEAIEEVLSMLKFMGLNKITSLTNVSENNVLDDLLEFECKLAGVLMQKQKQWGIDKALLPMIQTKIKTIVQDARFMAVNGNTIKAIQKTVQEHIMSSQGDKKGRGVGPYA